MAQEQSGDHRRRVTCEQTPGASSAQDNRGRFQWQFRNHEGFLPWPRQKAQRADACTPLVPAFRTLRQRTKSSRPASTTQSKEKRQTVWVHSPSELLPRDSNPGPPEERNGLRKLPQGQRPEQKTQPLPGTVQRCLLGKGGAAAPAGLKSRTHPCASRRALPRGPRGQTMVPGDYCWVTKLSLRRQHTQPLTSNRKLITAKQAHH